MSLADSFTAGRFTVALEITPPKSSLPHILQRRARLLGEAPGAINVIQRPGRQSSLEAAIELHAAGIEPVWHLVTRGKSRAALDADLSAARAAGIHNILCIRGDHEADTPDEITIRDACEAASAHPAAIVGATLNQYVADRAAVLRNLLPKLRAGARYVQTQPVFDLESLRPAAEAVLGASPETRIVAMAMPLTSLEAANRIESRMGVALPPSVRDTLASGDADAPWGAFAETLGALAASPLISGIALMTFEVDVSPDSAARMLAALQTAGAISPSASISERAL